MDDTEEDDVLAPPGTDEDWEEYLNSLQGQDRKAAEDILDEDNKKINEYIKLLEDAKQLGQGTLDELHKQGDQLKQVDENLNKIRRDNYKNKRGMRVIKSAFGSLFNKIFSCACLQPEDGDWEQEPPPPPKPHIDKPNKNGGSSGSTTPIFDKFKKGDEGLDEMKGLTLELDWLARRINQVVTTQNKNLDNLIDKADKALEEMRALTNSANNTLI